MYGKITFVNSIRVKIHFNYSCLKNKRKYYPRWMDIGRLEPKKLKKKTKFRRRRKIQKGKIEEE